MAIYTRSCIVCPKMFSSKRISAMYCSQKCRNKARSIGEEQLKSMIELSNRTLHIMHEMPKVVRDFLVRYNKEGVANDDPAKNVNPAQGQDIARNISKLIGLSPQDQLGLTDVASGLIAKQNAEKLKPKLTADDIADIDDPDYKEYLKKSGHNVDDIKKPEPIADSIVLGKGDNVMEIISRPSNEIEKPISDNPAEEFGE